MPNFRLPIAVCALVGDLFAGTASHETLDEQFIAAGAPLPIPGGAHHSKWKNWLVQTGKDPNVDSLYVLGNLLEEVMDLPSEPESASYNQWASQRERIVKTLEDSGLRYFRGGRVLPNGQLPETETTASKSTATVFPDDVRQLISTLIRGLPRAMHPLTHRRKDAVALLFESEYDVQDLLHSLLRPWVADIRPEEYTPSYAGKSTRMDFLLPEHKLVVELKFVRDKHHGKKIGDELIIDIEHYRRHPDCEQLWCVVYDSNNLLENPAGLAGDLDGKRQTPDGLVDVVVKIITGGNDNHRE